LLMLLGVLVLLLGLSAFFSGSETALMMLNRYRARHLAAHGHGGATRALALLERPDRLIGLILIGNNFVNNLLASIAAVVAVELGGRRRRLGGARRLDHHGLDPRVRRRRPEDAGRPAPRAARRTPPPTSTSRC